MKTDLAGQFTTGMILQLFELIKAIKHSEKNIAAIEIMAAALCSTAASTIKKPVDPRLDFNELSGIYEVVQEWKEMQRRIGGTFNLYKPEGMSRHRFLYLINQLYNCSASELIYYINMQKAINMLLFSNESIVAISELSGYTNKENFIAAFRNTYGVTPGHLRKQSR
jgi:hypothetical protein